MSAPETAPPDQSITPQHPEYTAEETALSKPDDASATAAGTDPEAAGKASTSKPDNDNCPACGTGLLYAIAYDENALHEEQPYAREGDPKGHLHYKSSGGSIRLHCFNCNRGFTKPLNGEDS